MARPSDCGGTYYYAAAATGPYLTTGGRSLARPCSGYYRADDQPATFSSFPIAVCGAWGMPLRETDLE